MKKYKFKISGQTYEVEIEPTDGENVTVSVNGTPYEVAIVNDTQKPKTPVLARKPVINQPGEGEIKKTPSSGQVHQVTSPLPGSISRLHFNVGDSVKAGECLLMMEAMKMENNVMAEKGGVIKSIKIKVGDAVLQGDILMEIAQ